MKKSWTFALPQLSAGVLTHYTLAAHIAGRPLPRVDLRYREKKKEGRGKVEGKGYKFD